MVAKKNSRGLWETTFEGEHYENAQFYNVIAWLQAKGADVKYVPKSSLKAKAQTRAKGVKNWLKILLK